MACEDIALMAHLMRRAGFGASREELEARAARGYEATVEELLNPDAEPVDRHDFLRPRHVDSAQFAARLIHIGERGHRHGQALEQVGLESGCHILVINCVAQQGLQAFA